MTPTEALQILQQFQRWRRDDAAGDDAMSDPPPNPREIGRALDVAIATLQSITTTGASPMTTPKTARKTAKKRAKAAKAKAGARLASSKTVAG